MRLNHSHSEWFKRIFFYMGILQSFLEAWKENKYRKPLILQGARQVGKTYSILEFGRSCYENVAYFNFETNPKLNKTFEENISPDYHIAALGSLLGVAAGRAKFSFPVGKVDMKTMYPMDMEEFILAMGEDALAEQIKKPLENYRDIDAFKIYVSDLGLLCAKKDLAANDVLYMVDELNDFKGGMTENYVNVQLTINGYKTYYWKSPRGAEIDFVIQRDGQLIPIEVKSADNTRAKSLQVYMDTYKPAYAIKISAKNFGFEDNKKTVPLYAAFCI